MREQPRENEKEHEYNVEPDFYRSAVEVALAHKIKMHQKERR